MDIMNEVMAPKSAVKTDNANPLIGMATGKIRRALIAELSKNRGEYLSSKHLIDAVGLSERSVQRTLLVLFSSGILSRRRRKKPGLHPYFEYRLAV